MAATAKPPNQMNQPRYWKRRDDQQFSIFDRNIGIVSLILLGLFVAGLIIIPQQVAKNVRQAVEDTLQRVGLAMLSVETKGQDVYISGQLASENLRTDIAKLHAIARGASCEVPVLGRMVCPAKVFLSLQAAERPADVSTASEEETPSITSLARVEAIQHDFSIAKDEDFVVIDGDIPNEKVRDLMLSQATKASLAVVDNMRITHKQPTEFFPWALERAWSILPYLERGELAWRAGRFSVNGRVTSEHQETVRANYSSDFFREQLAGLKLDVRPVYNDVKTCNQAFTEVFSHEALRFEPQSDKIDPASAGLLDQLAVLAEQCTLSFVVENHTDASADPDADLALSQRRAEQVVAALAARGITKQRLEAVGHGSKRLNKNNDTPIERMQNRRTNIVAKP